MPETRKLSVILVIVTGSMYITTSAGLIAFNKYLMAPGVFPYTCALVLIQQIFCSIMAAVLYLAMPSLFPSLADPEKKVSLNFSLGGDSVLLKGVLPVAVLFSIQLILTNQAYLFADIAFLQMIKECNVIAVYFMSIAFAIEVFQWRQMRLIILLVLATCMSVRGELHFSAIALGLQLSCFIFESLKITLQGVMLSGQGKGLDPLSYVLLVCPGCACIFGLIIGGSHFVFPDQHVLPMPAFSEMVQMRWMLLGNACLAFALNVSIAMFIKCSSAVSFVVSAIFKDVSIVLFDVLFLGKETTALQCVGFTFQMILILTWSLVKTFPKEFENDIFEGFRVVLSGKSQSFSESEKASEAYGSITEGDRFGGGSGKAKV